MKEWFKARNIWGAAIMTLSDAEAGRLAKALWAYTMTGEEQNLSGAEKGIFALITMTLSQDDYKDSDISEKRASAGSKGGKQKAANLANDNFAKEDIANLANATNKNKSKNKEKDIESIRPNENIQDRLFDKFWSVYPRHEGKQNALKAFTKLKPDEQLLETMVNAIVKQKQTSQWADPQYIPYPATWLNGRRWEDEPIKASAGGKKVLAQQYEQREYNEREIEERLGVRDIFKE